MKSTFLASASNLGGILLGLCASTGNNRTTKAQSSTENGEQEISFVVPELTEGQEYLFALLYANKGGTATAGDYVDYTDVIVTIDNEDMAYEEYGAMPSPEFPSPIQNISDAVLITTHARNFINLDSAVASSNVSSIEITDDSIIVTATNVSANVAIDIPINLVTTKRYSLKQTSAGCQFRNDANTVIYNAYNYAFATFTPASNITKVRLWFGSSNFVDGKMTINKSDFMLVEGEYTSDTMPEYEKYQEQTVSFPLAEGQKLYEGSYLADDGIHHVRGQDVLDGNQTVTKATNTATPYGYYFTVPITKLAKYVSGGNEVIGTMLSSHFKIVNNYMVYFDIGCMTMSSSKNKVCFFINESITTSSEAQAWLASNPVTAEYELAQEEIVPYTEAQQEAYDKLQQIQLYEGYTYIYTSNTLKPILSVNYGIEEKNLGNYIIPKPDTEEVTAQTEITGYDYMKKFDVTYEDSNTYPIRLDDYLENLCNQVGIILGSKDIINADYMIKGNPFTNGEKCKTVLSNIAQLACGFAKIGYDNKLYIISLVIDNETEEIIDGNNYTNFSKNNEFGIVNSVSIKMNSGVDGEETDKDAEGVTEENRCQIVIADNYFLTDSTERELVVENIFKAINGLSYLPCKFDYYGYPWLAVGTKIKILDVNDTEYTTYILNHTFKYNGGYNGTIESQALTKTQSTYKSTTDIKTFKRHTELRVNKIEGKITSIIQQQEGTQEQINTINQDVHSTSLKIAEVESETNSKINELTETIEGVSNKLTENGGNNIFYYDTEFWTSEAESVNLEEYTDTEIKNNSVSGMGYIVNSGSSKQDAEVQNGTYTVSFRYKKIGNELTNASVKINGEEYALTATDWTTFEKTIDVTTNHLEIEFISDTDNTLYVVDVLGNVGEEAGVWTQNPNETRTDTVKIGKGIQVESSQTNTYTRIDSDGNRTFNKTTGERVAEMTDKGVYTKELECEGQAQIAGMLIQQQGEQTWISSLL